VFLLRVEEVASSLTEFIVLLLLLGGDRGFSKLCKNFIPKLFAKESESKPLPKNHENFM